MSKKGKGIDYRKELEKSARQMILVRRVDTLVKLILRSIVRNLKIKHAGFLVYDRERDEYIVKVSRGTSDAKIPSGLVKVGKDNPLIKYFLEQKISLSAEGYLLRKDIDEFLLKNNKISSNLKDFLKKLNFQLFLYDAEVCIPGFFRDNLVYILFLGKKLRGKRFLKEELSFLVAMSAYVVMAIENAWTFEDLNKQLSRNEKMFMQTVMALAMAIEAKDKYTAGHTERVSFISQILAESVRNCKKNLKYDWKIFSHSVKIAALLHDIGKIGIPEKILNKRGRLNEKERKEIEKHPQIGYDIIKKIDEFQLPAQGVKYHHERYDGKGYPSQLKGRKIPLIAQIVSLADTYDALTSDRPYRKGFSRDYAISIIKNNRGKQFSPFLVDIFLKLCKNKII